MSYITLFCFGATGASLSTLQDSTHAKRFIYKKEKNNTDTCNIILRPDTRIKNVSPTPASNQRRKVVEEVSGGEIVTRWQIAAALWTY